MKTRTNVKINLGLNVLCRRNDGFHEIETLFLPYYGLGDELEINPSDEFSVSIEGSCVDWNPMSDLTVKAYELMKREYGIPPVSIRLVKGAPVGAGLGGGSADAAFALKMISDIFSLDAGEERLCDLASILGSDCAFFIKNAPAIGKGRGEILVPYDFPLERFRIELEVPENVSINTREAYRGVLDSRKGNEGLGIREALSLPVSRWRDVLKNDFENTVFPSHPEIELIKKNFYRRGAVYASMSGSGSAVFGLFEC